MRIELSTITKLLQELNTSINKLNDSISNLSNLVSNINSFALYDMPVDKQWSWETYAVGTKLLSANEEYDLIGVTDFSGWVWYGIMSFSSPNCGFKIRLETPRGDVLENEYTIDELYQLGLDTVPTPQGWWIPKYDTDNNIYSAAYTPNFPGTPFHKLSCKLVNKGNTPAYLYAAAIILIRMWEND